LEYIAKADSRLINIFAVIAAAVEFLNGKKQYDFKVFFENLNVKQD